MKDSRTRWYPVGGKVSVHLPCKMLGIAAMRKMAEDGMVKCAPRVDNENAGAQQDLSMVMH